MSVCLVRPSNCTVCSELCLPHPVHSPQSSLSKHHWGEQRWVLGALQEAALVSESLLFSYRPGNGREGWLKLIGKRVLFFMDSILKHSAWEGNTKFVYRWTEINPESSLASCNSRVAVGAATHAEPQAAGLFLVSCVTVWESRYFLKCWYSAVTPPPPGECVVGLMCLSAVRRLSCRRCVVEETEKGVIGNVFFC